MEIPVITTSHPIDFETLCRRTPLDLAGDWRGCPTSWDVRFIFAADPARIFYVVWMPFGPGKAVGTAPGPEKHDFFEGLWLEDVAEFFIKSDSTGRYQEFNLGPDGRWWSACFSSYRKREELDCNMPGVETFSWKGEGMVNFGISVPRKELKVDIAFSAGSVMNVTAIVNTPSQEFLIWSPPPVEEPDFHRMEHAAEVMPVE